MANNKSVLKFWIMPNTGFDSAKTFERELRDFHRMHPEIKVIVDIIPWTKAWRRIMEAVKKGTGPDIFQIGNTWAATCAYLGGLKDISDKIEEINESSFMDASIQACKFKEKFFAVPWFVDIHMLLYRKDIFEKLGLSKKDVSTWDNFARTVKSIKEAGFIPLGMSGRTDNVILQNISPWLWGGGGNFFSEDGKRAIFNEREALHGIKFYLDLLNDGAVSFDDLKLDRGTVMENFFVRDRYAMHVTGTWVYSTTFESFGLGETEFSKKFGIALLPKGPSGRYTFCGGSNLGINAVSSNREDAWSLLKFFLSEQSQTRYCKEIGMLPSLLSITRFCLSKRGKPGDVVQDLIKISRTYPVHPIWGSTEMILIDAMANILEKLSAGKYDFNHVKKELNKAAEEVNYLLSL